MTDEKKAGGWQQKLRARIEGLGQFAGGGSRLHHLRVPLHLPPPHLRRLDHLHERARAAADAVALMGGRGFRQPKAGGYPTYVERCAADAGTIDLEDSGPERSPRGAHKRGISKFHREAVAKQNHAERIATMNGRASRRSRRKLIDGIMAGKIDVSDLKPGEPIPLDRFTKAFPIDAMGSGPFGQPIPLVHGTTRIK